MSLKIFGGVFKGFTLDAPRNSKTRRTSIQLRRKLFDSIQDMQEDHFVDLCCGTGAMGIEALSRGVSKLSMVDTFAKLAQANLKKLTSKFDVEANISVQKMDAIGFLQKNLEEFRQEKPIIFFDPPYEKKDLYSEFMALPLSEIARLVVVEGCEQKTMRVADFEDKYGKADKVFKQGTSYFLLYRFDVE